MRLRFGDFAWNFLLLLRSLILQSFHTQHFAEWKCTRLISFVSKHGVCLFGRAFRSLCVCPRALARMCIIHSNRPDQESECIFYIYIYMHLLCVCRYFYFPTSLLCEWVFFSPSVSVSHALYMFIFLYVYLFYM